jgi:hypothetical protein
MELVMENQVLDWKKYTTEELEIVLPKTFIGGDPKKDKKAIASAISKVPEKYQQSMNIFFKKGNSKGHTPFMAIDSKVDESYDYLTCVNSFIEILPLFQRGVSIEKYLAEFSKKLGKQYKLVEEGLVTLQNYQAGRVIIHIMEKAGLFKKPTKILQIGIVYTMKVGSRVWNFFYYTTPARYDLELPVFEQSVDSVLIKVR